MLFLVLQLLLSAKEGERWGYRDQAQQPGPVLRDHILLCKTCESECAVAQGHDPQSLCHLACRGGAASWEFSKFECCQEEDSTALFSGRLDCLPFIICFMLARGRRFEAKALTSLTCDLFYSQ